MSGWMAGSAARLAGQKAKQGVEFVPRLRAGLAPGDGLKRLLCGGDGRSKLLLAAPSYVAAGKEGECFGYLRVAGRAFFGVNCLKPGSMFR